MELIPVQIRLLASMSAETFSYLRPHLQCVALKSGRFFRNAIGCSNTSISSSAASPPCSLARPETVLSKWPLSVAWGWWAYRLCSGRCDANRCRMQVPGEALRIASPDLRHAIEQCPELRQQLMNYVQALLVQNSQSVLCNVRHELRQRLCRWLLLACERLDDSIIPLTHELLSMTLGVRRAGVTMALARLEEKALCGDPEVRLKFSIAASSSKGLANAIESLPRNTDV